MYQPIHIHIDATGRTVFLPELTTVPRRRRRFRHRPCCCMYGHRFSPRGWQQTSATGPQTRPPTPDGIRHLLYTVRAAFTASTPQPFIIQPTQLPTTSDRTETNGYTNSFVDTLNVNYQPPSVDEQPINYSLKYMVDE
jgi:hypothetical protein